MHLTEEAAVRAKSSTRSGFVSALGEMVSSASWPGRASACACSQQQGGSRGCTTSTLRTPHLILSQPSQPAGRGPEHRLAIGTTIIAVGG